MKGGQIRPMSGAMVEGSRGDCDQAALYLTAHADLPCDRIIFCPRSGERGKGMRWAGVSITFRIVLADGKPHILTFF